MQKELTIIALLMINILTGFSNNYDNILFNVHENQNFRDSIKTLERNVSSSMDTSLSLMYSGKEPIAQDSLSKERIGYIYQDDNKMGISLSSPDSILTNVERSTDLLVKSLFGESRQLSDADAIIKKFDALPSFGIYKDNYFIVGTELFKRKDEWNSDAKFQVSIRHRITNSTLPFKTYLFLTYTQKAYWDIFRESFPFRDLNFNPSVGLGRALVYKNRLLGSISVQIEHESNGKDGDDSRSWNKVSFGATLMFDNNWSMQSKLWIPVVDGKGNRDIVQYTGWGRFGLEYMSNNRKYTASCVMTNRSGGLLNANFTMNFGARLFNDDNQYLFVEYYNGYGESMLDYKEHRNRIRLGIVIKADFLNFY